MNKKNWRSADYEEHLLWLLNWPIDMSSSTWKNPSAAYAHHAGRVRTLAWVVTGKDFTEEILNRKPEVRAYIKKLRQLSTLKKAFYRLSYILTGKTRDLS